MQIAAASTETSPMETFVNNIKHLYHKLTFADNFRSDFYMKLLGHNKVIAHEDGDPLYSLFIPAFMGKQYRNAMVGSTLGQMTNRRVPVFADIAITDQCNAECPHCYFKDLRKTRAPSNTLPKELVLMTMNDLQSMGINSIAFVGGEPLLYPDLTSIIREFDKSKTNLLLFTNGIRLAHQAKDLARAGLKRLYVSIDFADREKHDRGSGKSGVYDRAVDGVRRALKEGILTGFSTTLLPETTVDDLRALFELAHRLGVVEIYLNQTVDPKNCVKPVCPDNEFFDEVKRINSDKKYKFGILYYPFFSSRAALGGCSAGGTRIYVRPDGEVTGCDVLRRGFGNIKDENIFDIWYRMVNTPGYGDVYGSCRYALEVKESK